jgi:hypothetical protein
MYTLHPVVAPLYHFIGGHPKIPNVSLSPGTTSRLLGLAVPMNPSKLRYPSSTPVVHTVTIS